MKIIGIGGQPASGKSTMMREVIAALGGAGPLTKWKLHAHHELARWPAVVLGIYDGRKFDGTDRLSMACIGDSIEALSLFRRGALGPTPKVVLFEGDRLFNTRFLKSTIRNGTLKMFYLDASPSTLAARHAIRGDEQSPGWLQGRTTKWQGLLTEHASDFTKLPVDSIAEWEAARVKILTTITA